MYRIDALYATSEQQAVRKLRKMIAHVHEEEWIDLIIHDLTYRGDNVWLYTLKVEYPDKWYLLWWHHYHGRNCNWRNQDLW